jgi:hypothetical protein
MPKRSVKGWVVIDTRGNIDRYGQRHDHYMVSPRKHRYGTQISGIYEIPCAITYDFHKSPKKKRPQAKHR